MKRGISPELDYIISACFSGQAVTDGIKPDIGEIVRIIAGNRILNYAFERLDHRGIAGEVREKLESDYRGNIFANLLQAGETIKINSLAAGLGIPVHFYKGTVWSQWLFDDVKMRAPGDIDLFVAREQLLPLIDALKADGYAILPFHEMLLRSPEPVASGFLDSDYHIPLTCTDSSGYTKSVVELHWRIAYPRLCFDFDPTDFSPYRAEMSFMGHRIPVLSNEYQFLMMMVNHGGKEDWDRLKYVVDLKAYMDRYGLHTDWALVDKIAVRKGIKNLVSRGFGILRGLGYEWKPEFPAAGQRVNIEDFQNTWHRLTPLPGNASWSYFRHSVATRDFSHKFKVLKAHISFLTSFRLHRQKLKWYREHPGS